MIHETNFINKINFKQILLIALILRLIALFFAQGYSHHDDHFLVIEVAEAWVHKNDVANWFTSNYQDITSGRGLLYPGTHYIVFKGLDLLGIENVKIKVLIFRFIQILFSLLTVIYSFKIVKLLSDENKAKVVALICAILWIMPNIAVRSLTEVVVIPTLLMGSYLALKHVHDKKNNFSLLLAGLLFGISFSLRYQASVYVIGFLLTILFRKQLKEFLIMTTSGLVYFLLMHGIGDYLASGTYFGKIIYYVEYNLKFASSYINLPWYNHVLVVVGFLVPPVGIFLFTGSFKTKKEYLPVLIGTLLFLIVHSALKGKQERFMYTMLPFFILLGYTGWCELRKKITWKKLDSFELGSWKFSLVVNLIALVFLTTWFGKKSRVDVMDYFKGKPVSGYIVANHFMDRVNMLPQAYSSQWKPVYNFHSNSNYEDFISTINEKTDSLKPNYLLVEAKPGSTSLDEEEKWKQYYSNMKLETIIRGSLMDNIHYKANPIVRNHEYFVYKLY